MMDDGRHGAAAGHDTDGECKATNRQAQWVCGHSLTAPRASASQTCALPIPCFWVQVYQTQLFIILACLLACMLDSYDHDLTCDL
jgi:hypothetical protein